MIHLIASQANCKHVNYRETKDIAMHPFFDHIEQELKHVYRNLPSQRLYIN